MKKELSWSDIVGNILITIVIFIFTIQLLFSPQPYILLDYCNFFIHEVSGVFFISFNKFIFMLGQNIVGNLFPFIFFLYFLRKTEYASSLFCFFWLGDTLLQTGVYMRDAQTMTLPIVSIWGSGTSEDGHDFHYIFSQTGLLPYDQIIGGIFWTLGAICIVGSLLILTYLTARRVYEKAI